MRERTPLPGTSATKPATGPRSRRALTQARNAALAGRTDEAIAALRGLADEGNAAASASLAELLAFRRQWDECALHAERLLAQPDAVYAGNVFDNMLLLAGLVGHETGNWPLVQETARRVRSIIRAGGHQPHNEQRYLRLLDALADYAARRGAPPHDFILVHKRPDAFSPEEWDRSYRQAIEDTFSYYPRMRTDEAARARHHFGLAKSFRHPEDALEIYRRRPDVMTLDDAAYVARILAKRGEHDAAWALVQAKLGNWFRCDAAFVAPVVLLVDRDLRPMMTPERCEEVLATPR